MPSVKFHLVWPSGFRGKDFQKQELPMAAIFVNVSGRNKQIFWRTFHRYFLQSFGSFGHSFREDFQKSINHKQELPMVAMFVNRMRQNEQTLQRTCHRCFQSSFNSFGQAVSGRRLKCEKICLINLYIEYTSDDNNLVYMFSCLKINIYKTFIFQPI